MSSAPTYLWFPFSWSFISVLYFNLYLADFLPVLDLMRQFSDALNSNAPDEERLELDYAFCRHFYTFLHSEKKLHDWEIVSKFLFTTILLSCSNWFLEIRQGRNSLVVVEPQLPSLFSTERVCTPESTSISAPPSSCAAQTRGCGVFSSPQEDTRR